MKKQHWSDADKQLTERMEKENPDYVFRVLRGSLHDPYLQRRPREGAWNGQWETVNSKPL